MSSSRRHSAAAKRIPLLVDLRATGEVPVIPISSDDYRFVGNPDGYRHRKLLGPDGKTYLFKAQQERRGFRLSAPRVQIAVYRLAKSLGVDTPIVHHVILDGREGSLQEWRQAETPSPNRAGMRRLNITADPRSLYEMAVLDAITGEPDRHASNYLVDPDDGHVIAIDNDLAFNGRMFWQVSRAGGEATNLIRRLLPHRGELVAAVTPLLTHGELAMLRFRLKAMPLAAMREARAASRDALKDAVPTIA